LGPSAARGSETRCRPKLRRVAREALATLPDRPTRLLLSFHGLPKRYADLGDPYPDQCRATAELLVSSLGMAAERGCEQFHSAGGRDYLAIPCLNEHPAWLEAMTAIARRELAGWI
jgi:protoheme ferro-lyase